MKNEAGLMIFGELGSDKPTLEAMTLACVHCGGHFPAKAAVNNEVYGAEQAVKMRDAGKTMRGFCMNCNGPICGPDCAECVPLEQFLENIEHGRDIDFKPVVSSTSKATMWFPPSAV